MTEQAKFPELPQFSDEQIQKCRETGDFMPVLFEWYKFVGQICISFALIARESPAVKEISPIHYAILTGLLNRCARLMLSNIALSHNGRFGETTAILDRCIFESCIKVEWLCHKGIDDSFQSYLASGLKTEIELESKIRENIAEREDGAVLNIEKRMLASIDHHINTSGLNREEIGKSKKLPDFLTILRDLGHERLIYVVSQRIGSHHVHGTWPSLLFHYLEVNEEGYFSLRDHTCDTHPNQFIMISLQVLEAVKSFIIYAIEKEEAEPIVDSLKSIQEKIMHINAEIIGSDFKNAEEI